MLDIENQELSVNDEVICIKKTSSSKKIHTGQIVSINRGIANVSGCLRGVSSKSIYKLTNKTITSPKKNQEVIYLHKTSSTVELKISTLLEINKGNYQIAGSYNKVKKQSILGLIKSII